MLLATLLSLSLGQVDMAPHLQRGPLVLVEQDKSGKFTQATAIVLIDAPPEKVWETVQKIEDFKTFMPKILESEVIRRGPKDFDAHFVVDVPGPDTNYKLRYTPDNATRTMEGTWLSGDLKGSHWLWRADPGPNGKTLLYHAITLKNFSSLAQSFDDDAQTLTVGINVTSALAAAKAIKKRVESTAAPASPAQ